jgi:2-(1,2-epoxy-1,2-dihydrophenyl)acetyl-CoA isomerase
MTSGAKTYESLIFEVEEGVATLTLNRPDALNALNLALKAELAAAIAEIRDRDDVRAVLLTGAGRGFCAGGDIKEMDPNRTPPAARRRMLKILTEILLPLTRLEKPVVAAVNGHAHGAGVSLALASDIVYAAESAVFSLAFSRLGLIPDTGALFLLPRRVGVARAKELVFSARRFSAAEAEELGIVLRVLPDDELLPAATELARRLGAGPTIALGIAKRLLDQSLLLSPEDMAELEAYGQAVATATNDHAEGIAAFGERREPRFTGS